MQIRRSLLIWALVLLAPGLLLAEEDEREFARQRLFAIADMAVHPDKPDVGGLDDVQAATAKDRETLGGQAATTFSAIDELVGVPASESTERTEGLIQQGSRLYRWVTGQLVEAERSAPAPAPTAEEPNGGDEEKPKDPPRDPPKKEDGEGDGDEPKKDDAPEKPPEPPAPPPETFDYMPQFVMTVGDTSHMMPPRVPTERRDLTDEQRNWMVNGEISVQTSASANGPVIALRGVERLIPYANKEPDRFQGRFPLVFGTELESPLGIDYLNWRKVQLAIRQERWAQDQAQGLVTDAEVRRRELYVERAQRRLDDLEAARTRVHANLARIDQGERQWTRRSGVLSSEIEDLQRQCEECEEAQRVELQAQVDRKTLEDRRAQLELRLLYVTVRRAKAQLGYIDELETLSKEELRLAQSVYQRFLDASNRGRRQRQLAGLRYQELTLDQDVAELRRRQETASDDRKAGFQGEIDVLESMRGLTQDLVDLVELRTTLEVRSTPPERGVDAAAPDTEEKDGSGTLIEPDPLRSVRNPSVALIDEGYIQLVREKLTEPGFDSNLVALQYEAADELSATVRDALETSTDLPEREAQFEAGAADLTERMAAYPYLWQRRRELSQMQTTFAETTRSIRRNQERVRARLEVLDAWKAELLGLGIRSFKIRVNRTLSGEQLGIAGRDMINTTNHALDWVQMKSDPNMGDFVETHWLGLLAGLGLLLAAGIGIVQGRSRIDAYLKRTAREYPSLRTSLEVRQESDEKKEVEAAAEAARLEAEAAALNKAAGEEVGTPEEKKAQTDGESV